MAYVLTVENPNEIAFESKRISKIGCATYLIPLAVFVFTAVGYWLVPEPIKYFIYGINGVILIAIVTFVLPSRTRFAEFKTMRFSAQHHCILFEEKKGFKKVSLAFNEISGFEVDWQEVSKRTYGAKTSVIYNYVLRMNLTDGSSWLILSYTSQNDAQKLALSLNTMVEKYRREHSTSEGFVPKRILHTRLGSKSHEFQWTNRNIGSFLLFTFFSLFMIAFFGGIIWLLFDEPKDWLQIVVAVVFTFFFVLIMGFIQLIEFPKQLKPLLYTYELILNRKSIKLEGIRKNRKRNILFEKSIDGNDLFILNHCSDQFSQVNERNLRFVVPSKRLENSTIKEKLIFEFNEQRNAQFLPLNKLSLYEVLAFRNYLNEITRGLRV